jgi:hypothetical protein
MGKLHNLHSAFPRNGTEYDEGMALIDYFAAKAMQGFLDGCDTYYKDIPKLAYELAQLMMEERTKHV